MYDDTVYNTKNFSHISMDLISIEIYTSVDLEGVDTNE